MRVIGRRLTVICVLFAVLGVPSIVRSAEVDELKASVEQLIGALNKRDLDAWSPFVHDQVVGFNLISPFPAEGKAAMRQGFQGLFAMMESFTIIPLNWQYRVVGDTGYSWGHVVVTFKPKDGPVRTM